MKQRRDIVPHMHLADMTVNISLTLAKIRKRIRMINPNYKQGSRYQARLKHKRAARRTKPGMVR